MSLPIVSLAGSPEEQGVQHGRALRARIARNLEIYARRFERELGLSWTEARARAARWLELLPEQNAGYAANLRGVATGSGCDPIDLAVLNLRYELCYFELGREAIASPTTRGPDGCTAFACLPAATADGHLVIGQNWDWIPEVQGAILRAVEPEGTETLTFTEAGIVGGKIGLSSNGIGLVINGLTTTDDDWSRPAKPFHLRCYEILRAPDLDAALRVVADGERACAANFLIARAPDRAVDVEAAPRRVRRLDPADGLLVHANHFLDPAALAVVETASEPRAGSCARQERLGALLHDRRPLRIDALRVALADHAGAPESTCRHPDPSLPPDEQYVTVISAIIDLTARILEVADGTPCAGEWRRYHLGGD